MSWTHKISSKPQKTDQRDHGIGLTAAERQVIDNVREAVLEADPTIDERALDAALQQFWRPPVAEQGLFSLVSIALNVHDGRVYH
jgi:hypothetical protein